MAAEQAKGFQLLKITVVFMVSFLWYNHVTDAQSILQAEFRKNPIDENGNAQFLCRVSNLGSNVLTIERKKFSRIEKIAVNGKILPSVDDNFFQADFENGDGSKTYIITIRGVHHIFDAGTYTCRINAGNSVLAEQSAILNINYTPGPSDPRCSIVGSSENLSRMPGNEVRLGCHSELGYPPVDISWSYSGCNMNRALPQPELTNSGAYYSELRVTLSEEDDGGVFTCTISRPDGSFSSSCSRGPFVIPGDGCMNK